MLDTTNLFTNFLTYTTMKLLFQKLWLEKNERDAITEKSIRWSVQLNLFLKNEIMFYLYLFNCF